MSDLFLRYNFSFNHELLASVVRPKTLMVLRQLDPARKAYLISFLHDSHLLFRNDLDGSKNGFEPIKLAGADLECIEVSIKVPSTDRRAWLGPISLAGTSLTNSSFVNRDMVKADFTNVYADSTDFTGADIVDARFYRAPLRHANFEWTAVRYNDFTKADLTDTKYIDDNSLHQAISLVGTILPNGTKARGHNLLKNPGGESALDSECDGGGLPEYWKTHLGRVTTVRSKTNNHRNKCFFVGTGSADISSIYQIVSLDHARYWTEQGRGELYTGAFLSPNSYVNVTQVILPYSRIAGPANVRGEYVTNSFYIHRLAKELRVEIVFRRSLTKKSNSTFGYADDIDLWLHHQ